MLSNLDVMIPLTGSLTFHFPVIPTAFKKEKEKKKISDLLNSNYNV